MVAQQVALMGQPDEFSNATLSTAPVDVNLGTLTAYLPTGIDSPRFAVENVGFRPYAPGEITPAGTPTEVTLSALLQRNRDLPDYGFPFVTSNGTGTVRKPLQAPADVFYGYGDDHFNQSVNVLSATIQHKLTPTATLRNRTLISANRTAAVQLREPGGMMMGTPGQDIVVTVVVAGGTPRGPIDLSGFISQV